MQQTLPSGDKLATMSPDQIKELINTLATEKANLTRQIAVHETEYKHYQTESGKIRQELVALTGSDDPAQVESFIAAKLAEAADALNKLAALYQAPEVQSAAPIAPAAANTFHPQQFQPFSSR